MCTHFPLHYIGHACRHRYIAFVAVSMHDYVHWVWLLIPMVWIRSTEKVVVGFSARGNDGVGLALNMELSQGSVLDSLVIVTLWYGRSFCIAVPLWMESIGGLSPRRTEMQIFDVCFVVSRNNLFIKQSVCRWVATPWHKSLTVIIRNGQRVIGYIPINITRCAWHNACF